MLAGGFFFSSSSNLYLFILVDVAPRTAEAIIVGGIDGMGSFREVSGRIA